MSLLQFLPWCRLDRDYKVGNIRLRRFTRDRVMGGTDALTWHRICRILGSYKSNDGTAVKEAVVIQYLDNNLLLDLSEDQRDEAVGLVEVAAFTALANRDFFDAHEKGVSNRCNSTDFQLITQRFTDEPTYTSILVRSHDVHQTRGWNIADLSITRPIQASNQVTALDENLLTRIITYRDGLEVKERERFVNAISCFNLANTFHPSMLPQVDWVFLVAAFQQILDATKASDVASKFQDQMKTTRIVQPGDSQRCVTGRKNGHSLLYEWMEEFCRVRGDFAHGRLITKQHAKWKPVEHLILARIAFPLFIKCRVKEYSLTQGDRDQLAIFERFTDEDFLSEENSWLGKGRSLWMRLLQQQRIEA